MKTLYLPGSLLILLAAGFAGVSHGPGERRADAANGKTQVLNSATSPNLAGSWRLVSFHTEDPTGQTAYPFGKYALGRLTYEPDGRMAVQLMDPRRPALTSGDPLVTSEAELRAAFGGYTAYYGSYSVDPARRTIVHHIEAALLPNWVGTDQERQFEFDGELLTLKGPLLLGGVPGTVSLVWKRLP